MTAFLSIPYTHIATPPPKSNWPRIVRDRLDALPADGWTPCEDLEAMLAACSVGRRPMPGDKVRVRALLACACNDRGQVAIDGQTALIEALRVRCTA